MENNNKRKPFSMTGFVASDRMNKTRIVIVEKTLKHTRYDKAVKKKIRYKAHDEQNQSHIGDKVEIVITRPYCSSCKTTARSTRIRGVSSL